MLYLEITRDNTNNILMGNSVSLRFQDSGNCRQEKKFTHLLSFLNKKLVLILI